MHLYPMVLLIIILEVQNQFLRYCQTLPDIENRQRIVDKRSPAIKQGIPQATTEDDAECAIKNHVLNLPARPVQVLTSGAYYSD